MRIALSLVILIAADLALAAPPSGYNCGDGKPSVGRGCDCPAGKIDARDSENTAICVAKPQAKPAAVTAIEISTSVDANLAGATIMLDGQAKGVAPQVLKIAAGRHLVELDKPGFEKFSQWVEVKAGQQLTLAIVLRAKAPPVAKKGSILVEATLDDAEVVIHGTAIRERTPTVLNDLAEGSYIVEVRKPPAAPWKMLVTVKAGEQVKVLAKLVEPAKPEPAKIEPRKPPEPAPITPPPPATGNVVQVTSEVPDLVVFIDGKQAGKVPLDARGIALGNHTLTTKLDGYLDMTATIKVTPGPVAVRIDPPRAKNDALLDYVQTKPSAMDDRIWQDNRPAAIRALAALKKPGRPKALLYLAERLKGDRVRPLLIELVGDLGDQSHVQALEQIAAESSSNYFDQAAALQAKKALPKVKQRKPQ